MTRLGAAMLALSLTAAAALPADAQNRDRDRRPIGEPAITLYELPNFEGRSMAFYFDAPDLADQKFNDRARSARIEGSWRLCQDSKFRGRCEPFADDVRDFAAFGFSGQISSLQMVGGRPGRPGFEGPAYSPEHEGPVIGRDGVEGRTAVFFRRPSMNGARVLAQGQGSADAFCRVAGLAGGAVYFNEQERAREVVDIDGRPHPDAPALSDVLCRR